MPLDLVFTGTDSSYDNVLTLTLASPAVQGVNATPVPVWFSCDAVSGAGALAPGQGEVYDAQSHRIIYFWNFGDPVSTVPVNTASLTIPAEWKNLNTAYGREVCHVFKSSGTKTVTCYAYEPATKRFGSATVDVQIGNADAFFTGANTIIYDPLGSANTSAYQNPTVVTTTWADVLSARAALGAGSTARILVADGAVISDRLLFSAWNPVVGQNQSVNYSNFWVEAMPGATVTIMTEREDDGIATSCVYTFGAELTDLRLVGLTIVGGWDSTTERGTANLLVGGGNKPNGFTQLICGCDISGLAWIAPPGTLVEGDSSHVVHETTITNWRNYGLLGAGPNWKTSVIGCSIRQHPDALSGGSKNALHNDHGPFRDYGSGACHVEASAFFSRNGWFGGINGTDPQPCLRLNTNGQTGYVASVSRVVTEGCAVSLKEQGNPGMEEPAVNVVFDKMLSLRGSTGMQYMVDSGFGGVTVRNWLAVQLDAPVSQRNLSQMVTLDTRRSSTEALAAPVEIYNATLLDLRSDTNAESITLQLINELNGPGGPFQNVNFENNVLHQPNRTGVINEDVPIDLSTMVADVTSRGRGPRFNFEHIGGDAALGADVPDGASMAEIPYAQITDDLVGRTGGNPTDQAYWQANLGPGSRLSLHTVGLSVQHEYRADRGHFTITITATGLVITNTSGQTWEAADYWSFLPDRVSVIPPFVPAYDTRGDAVPLPVPQPGSAALTGGGADPSAYDDFWSQERTGEQAGALIG